MRNPTGIPLFREAGLDFRRAQGGLLLFCMNTRVAERLGVSVFLMDATCVLLCVYAYTMRHLLVEYLEKN
jgi:hypothetical protein